MRWTIGIPLAVVLLASGGCGSSTPTPPSEPAAGPAHRVTWLTAASVHGAGAELTSSAVIDGFRVHPDPGNDGVIHAFEGEKVVINATDIASRPPDPQSYLVVNWGDGPNQRVGCGPCRLDHTYGAGRYTLVASSDGTATGKSISIVVEITTPREKLAPIQPFAFTSSDIGVGETTYLLLPLIPPAELDLPVFLDLDCSPPGAATLDLVNVVFLPPNVGLPFTGVAPGTCTFTLSGTASGTPFSQSATFKIH